METNKDEMRQAMRQRVALLTEMEIEAASGRVCRRLLDLQWIEQADGIAVYAAFSKEISLALLVDATLARGDVVCYPRFNHRLKSYEMAVIEDRERDLVRGWYGILEPGTACAVAESPQAMVWLVPGVAFCADGRRLGRGGGYYDRLLADVTGPKIGVAYDWQIVDHLPVEGHDIKVDLVVTDIRRLGPLVE